MKDSRVMVRKVCQGLCNTYSPGVAPSDYQLFPEFEKYQANAFQNGRRAEGRGFKLPSQRDGGVLQFRHKRDGTPYASISKATSKV
ncbi:hypothetical protein Trydic_g18425 [Trypoxylus dichotomus]